MKYYHNLIVTLSGSNNNHNVQILDKYRRVNGVVYPFVSCTSFGEQQHLNRTKILDERAATFSAKPNKARKTLEVESVSPWNSFLEKLLSNQFINLFAYLSGFSNTVNFNKTTSTNQNNSYEVKDIKKVEEVKVKEVKMHPNKQIVAVAFSNDNVYFYDLHSENWKVTEQGNSFVLIHEFQKEIETIEWLPCNSFSLAVGCKYGICIWSMVFSASSVSGGTVNSSNVGNVSSQSIQIVNGRFLSFPSHFPISCISCSSDGKFISSSSLNDNALIVWDISSSFSPSVLRRGFSNGFFDEYLFNYLRNKKTKLEFRWKLYSCCLLV